MKHPLQVSLYPIRGPPVKRQFVNRKAQAVLAFCLAQRAKTAFLALSLRSCEVRFLARALPPFLPSAAACGFFMP
jgi:hypothetical protein